MIILEPNELKEKALDDLSAFLDSLDPKRCRVLSYWISDYVRFLRKEDEFDPKKLVRYKRGSIVKVHLGYRIGSEEGGLHYAVVLDVKNALSSNTVTIIPLTSIKESTDLDNLHFTKISLGDEIYLTLSEKLTAATADIKAIQDALSAKLDKIEANPFDSSAPDYKIRLAERRTEIMVLREQLEIWKRKALNVMRLEKEIGKMKRGSIALVGQITTVSKIRIYDPLYPSDSLASIHLSDAALDKLDQKVKELYTYEKK